VDDQTRDISTLERKYCS